MFGLGFGEFLMIATIVLIVFSASRMGALGNAVGRFVHEYRKASRGEGYVDVNPAGRFERGQSEAEVLKEPEKR